MSKHEELGRFRANSIHPAGESVNDNKVLVAQASQAAEEVVYFVIPSEARNLSALESQRKRDSSARSMPRNDKIVIFSAASSACGGWSTQAQNPTG